MKIKRISNGDGSLYGFSFHCPGCDKTHEIPTTGSVAWGFNGDESRPTFTPSILVHSHKRYELPDSPQCHSYVTDGRIQFLNDSTHALAGQTVDLPEIEA